MQAIRTKVLLCVGLGFSAAYAVTVAAQTPTITAADCPLTVIALAEPAAPAPRPEKHAAYQGSASERDACRLSIEDFVRERAGFTLIDTRDAGERARLRIAGALALGVAEIDSKSFLNDANLVLTGSGIDDAALVNACMAMRHAGRTRVGVLQGGVHALFRNGQPVAGDGEEIGKLDWLTPEELHRLAARSPKRVVLLGIADAAAVPGALASAQHLAINADLQKTAARLHQLGRGELGALLAVVTATKEQALALHEALRLGHADNVFVVREGLPAYVAYLGQQQRIAANANIRLIHPCGSS